MDLETIADKNDAIILERNHRPPLLRVGIERDIFPVRRLFPYDFRPATLTGRHQ
jgi:hypothetical protein